MTHIFSRQLRLAILGICSAALAACASAPVPQDFTAPARKPLDAKTKLESGRY
jgi:hypothetical protein